MSSEVSPTVPSIRDRIARLGLSSSSSDATTTPSSSNAPPPPTNTLPSPRIVSVGTSALFELAELRGENERLRKELEVENKQVDRLLRLVPTDEEREGLERERRGLSEEMKELKEEVEELKEEVEDLKEEVEELQEEKERHMAYIAELEERLRALAG